MNRLEEDPLKDMQGRQEEEGAGDRQEKDQLPNTKK
jgi:hypothetical protein